MRCLRTADDAERMRCKVLGSDLPPCRVVTALGWRTALCVVGALSLYLPLGTAVAGRAFGDCEAAGTDYFSHMKRGGRSRPSL